MPAGIDMIPAPTTLVDTLKTAPSTDAEPPPAGAAGPACSGRSRASSAATLSLPALGVAENGGFLDAPHGLVFSGRDGAERSEALGDWEVFGALRACIGIRRLGSV